MKKGFIIVAAMGLFVAVSCKKNHTCRCTYTTSGLTITADTVFTDMKKKDAETDCEAMSVSATTGGTTASVECALVD
ncbi:MAG TPA: hypothetical protein EYG85_03195 [Crocinitomix sp.]|nr:hypothetical protein [Crocinitomix sp.]